MKKADLERAIVDHLVAGLSDPQRVALLWLPADGGERPENEGSPRMRTSLWTLAEKNVVPGVAASICRHNGKGFDGMAWRATALGLKVRARLESAS